MKTSPEVDQLWDGTLKTNFVLLRACR